VIFSNQNHAGHAARLGVLLDSALNAQMPGTAGTHSSTYRENLRTYQVWIPGREPFEVFLDADDSLLTGGSDERRVESLMKKIAARLTEVLWRES
jgi:hypothetical protein